MKTIDKKSSPKETMEEITVQKTSLGDILKSARIYPKRGPVDNDPPMVVYSEFN